MNTKQNNITTAAPPEKSAKDTVLQGLGKPVAQPYVDTFPEVFEDCQPYDLMSKKAHHAFAPRYIVGQNVAGNLYNNVKRIMQHNLPPTRFSDERMKVGPFCTFEPKTGSKRFFSVSCADWVLSRLKERTIVIGDDTMTFELIDHGNGWTLVTAHHGMILGSVWLAYIKTDSVPKG